MIGLYVVDAILIIGLAYLCFCPHKKYNFDNPDSDCEVEDINSNYLTFDQHELEIETLV